MNDPFFASTRKRKRANAAKNKKPNDGPRSQPKRTQKDEEISGDEKESDVGDLDAEASEPESSEEEIEETAAEKRVRLAKAYLDKIQDDLDESYAEGFDAADLDRDIISERLKQDVDEQEGRLHRRVADTFDYDAAAKTIRRTSRAHKASVTAVAFTENGKFLYTASADCSIIKWDLETLRKLHVFKGGRRGVTDFAGHTDHILCLAVSSDGKYLASGGKDKLIHIWSVPENKLLGTFRQHRDAISSLAFRKGHNQLYSGSFDRTVKVWSVDELAYVETLFGHQDHITQLDTLGRERCVSTGGRDKTSRLWKIVEESQLVFRGGARSKSKGPDDKPLYVEGSLDCIAQVEEGTFITGGDSGVIAMWDIGRKKPTFTFSEAHGISTTETIMGEINQPYWITALASLRYSDVFASGSWDGKVRLWKIAGDNKSFAPLAEFEVEGVVNSLQFKTASNNRTFLVIGVGQELRYGRWLSLKKIRNEAKIIELTTLSKNQTNA